MPTYTVSASKGVLSAADKQTIATAITRTHHEVTGAQTFFAQVIFTEISGSDWYMGGTPAAPNAVFVHGQIRAGRTAELRRALLTGLLDSTAAAARVPETSVWVYLVELLAENMVEYGHILPEPGAEARWLADLPASDSALMQATGMQSTGAR